MILRLFGTHSEAKANKKSRGEKSLTSTESGGPKGIRTLDLSDANRTLWHMRQFPHLILKNLMIQMGTREVF
mgnify:CR=1 FL=1